MVVVSDLFPKSMNATLDAYGFNVSQWIREREVSPGYVSEGFQSICRGVDSLGEDIDLGCVRILSTFHDLCSGMVNELAIRNREVSTF